MGRGGSLHKLREVAVPSIKLQQNVARKVFFFFGRGCNLVQQFIDFREYGAGTMNSYQLLQGKRKVGTNRVFLFILCSCIISIVAVQAQWQALLEGLTFANIVCPSFLCYRYDILCCQGWLCELWVLMTLSTHLIPLSLVCNWHAT